MRGLTDPPPRPESLQSRRTPLFSFHPHTSDTQSPLSPLACFTPLMCMPSLLHMESHPCPLHLVSSVSINNRWMAKSTSHQSFLFMFTWLFYCCVQWQIHFIWEHWFDESNSRYKMGQSGWKKKKRTHRPRYNVTLDQNIVFTFYFPRPTSAFVSSCNPYNAFVGVAKHFSI